MPSDGLLRIALLCGRGDPTSDGIISYSSRLARALGEQDGVEADVHVLDRRRWVSVDDRRDAKAADAYLLQYNPFAFGRWGFAPWLPRAWSRMARSSAARSAVTVHEAHVRFDAPSALPMGAWQRAQLAALMPPSAFAIATCREREDALGLWRRQRAVHHVPVGSNLDDVSDDPEVDVLRERLRGPLGRLVLATFSTGHPSHLFQWVSPAVRAIRDAVGDHVVLNLGRGSPVLSDPPAGVEVIAPGRQEQRQLALHLAAADLVLLPFSNGAITNRTTLMAALQHGRPVLSTRGPRTDAELDGGAPRLVDVARPGEFAAAAAALAADESGRAKLGAEGRALYDERFAWPVIADQVIRAIAPS